MAINLNQLPLVSTGRGAKVMDSQGVVYTRVLNPKRFSTKGNFIVTLQQKLMGNVIETVATIKDGHIGIEPVIIPNKVFMDKDTGIYYILGRQDNMKEVRHQASLAKCGYLLPVKQADGTLKPVAYFKGKVVETPRWLVNECGVELYLVDDLVAYGEVCKRSTGFLKAQKIACVYKLPSKVGDVIATVVNGVQEHTAVIEEGEVKVQNPGGEAYKMKEAKLHKSYTYKETTPEGYEVWKPKNELKTWVRSGVNIICILWGAFEVLTTPMICIDDPTDTYGCNYVVFYGCDTYEATYQVRQIFLPVNAITHQPEITSVLQAGYVRTLASIPKVEYVEAPDLLRLSSLLRWCA